MKKSILVKITGLFFLMLLVAVINVATVYFYLTQQQYDTHIVNVAGRQRMLSQRISKLALSVASGEDTDRKPLRESIIMYDRSLAVLFHGGKAMNRIIPASSEKMNDLFQNNKALWSSFKKYADIIVNEGISNSSFKKAIRYIKEHNDKLLMASDLVTKKIDDISSKKIIFLKGTLLILFLIDLLFFSVGYFVAMKIVYPLKNLSELAVKIGAGDFTTKAEITTKDEVGELAESFNKMMDNLSVAIEKEKEAAAQTAVAENKKEQADKFSQLKSQFVANVSHEFKNPLTVIQGSLSLILDGAAGEIPLEQEKLLTIARRSIERLIRLVTNLLDISKIESGKMKIDRQLVDISTIVAEVVEEQKGTDHVLKTKGMSSKNHTIYNLWADRDMLIQVVTNLVSNAIKYTPDGGSISIEFVGTEKEVRLEVSDSGPGIAKEDIAKVFDKFERIIEENQEGTGLGLPITKDIVALHKGKIWIESEMGKGSTFIITLPRK